MLLALAALTMLLGACEYRPERGKVHAEESPSHQASESPSIPGPNSTEGITDPGLGPTNPPPKVTGGYRVRTLAGSGSHSFADGKGAAAAFGNPFGIAAAPDGNVYVADAGSNRIRKIARDGTVTTFAGTGAEGYKDGPAAQAQFRFPRGVALGPDGSVFVADTFNHVIRVISPTGVVSTLVGTPGRKGLKNAPGTKAMLYAPVAIAVAADGRTLYVTEFENHIVRVLSRTGQVVKTLAGTGRKGFKDGDALKTQFDSPVGIVVDAAGTVFVADAANHRVRSIAGGTVRTIAGSRAGFKDGTGAAALLNLPFGLTTDRQGLLFVTDFANNTVRTVTKAGVVRTIVSPPRGVSSGPNELNLPAGLSWLGGRLFLADSGSAKIRIIERG
ncbi:MAG: hypothetical protein ACRDJM_03410 [Actinomycetota bacterium]